MKGDTPRKGEERKRSGPDLHLNLAYVTSWSNDCQRFCGSTRRGVNYQLRLRRAGLLDSLHEQSSNLD